MKVAVYSGSFNPLHIGHEAIMRYLTREGLFDEVYLIISPKNPLKSTISADSAQARYTAAVNAVKRHPDLKVKVDDIELRMDAPNYSIKTLDALQAREPENEFSLVIGGDNLACIRKWKDYQRILLEYGVVVYPRAGTDIEQIRLDLKQQEKHFQIRVINAPLFNISSSEIRKGLEEGRDMTSYLM